MDIKTLIALSDKFDKAEEEESANQIDALIKGMGEEINPLELNLPEHAPEDKVIIPSQISENKLDKTKEMFGLAESFKKFVDMPTMQAYDSLIENIGKYMIYAKEKDIFAASNNTLEKLAFVADKLDSIGAVEEANMVDEIIKKKAEMSKCADKKPKEQGSYDAKEHHSRQIREPKREQERADIEGRKNHHVHTYQETGASGLSTRYCPEHIGVMLGRVGDNTYQCSLDGQIYNWETGFIDFDGVKHPGGSVAAQTPESTEHAIPHRIFDSREKILNTIN